MSEKSRVSLFRLFDFDPSQPPFCLVGVEVKHLSKLAGVEVSNYLHSCRFVAFVVEDFCNAGVGFHEFGRAITLMALVGRVGQTASQAPQPGHRAEST
jgi:hypothetical protein